LTVAVLAFRDGEFSPLSETTVGIGTRALHYGTNIFEVIGAYRNPDVAALFVFRANNHWEQADRG
jgi:branched-subunit amino acid aminotransferase/4-amino-4-deoxychorismate lyase